MKCDEESLEYHLFSIHIVTFYTSYLSLLLISNANCLLMQDWRIASNCTLRPRLVCGMEGKGKWKDSLSNGKGNWISHQLFFPVFGKDWECNQEKSNLPPHSLALELLYYLRRAQPHRWLPSSQPSDLHLFIAQIIFLITRVKLIRRHFVVINERFHDFRSLVWLEIMWHKRCIFDDFWAHFREEDKKSTVASRC